jgi:hypothetical protein
MRSALAYLSLVLLATACERKAPGPDECIAFAVQAVGGGQALLRRAELRDQVDELTQRCLTTPYDRRLLSCMQTTGNLRACVAQFERRRAAQ